MYLILQGALSIATALSSVQVSTPRKSLGMMIIFQS